LDRALASPAWCGQFPGVVVEVLPVTTSDHKPLWLRFKPSFQLAPILFRFEACWNVDEDCGAVIEQAWERDMTGCNSVEAAQLKLECCKNELLALRGQKYGVGRRNLIFLKNKLEKLQSHEHLGTLTHIKQVQQEINKLLEIEDIKWR
jgi:hypothetical protein